jgi:hypothetical protein
VVGTYSVNHIEIKWWHLNIWPTAVSWPKIIQSERISNLICNLWLYTLISKIKSISPNIAMKQIFRCHHFISIWFEILTLFLVWECIIISYRSNVKLILVEWFLANLQPLGFGMTRMSPPWILRRLANVSPFFNSLSNRLRITNYCLRSVSSRWAMKFGQIFSCHHFISLWFEILTWFLVWECIIISYRSSLKFLCYS